MKKTEKYKKVLIWLLVGFIASIFSHFLIEILLYKGFNYEYVFSIIFNGREKLFLLGSFVLFIVYILLSSLIGNVFIGSGLLIFLSWLFGIANRYKRLFREEPLFPNELYMVRELPFLLEMIGTERIIIIISSIILLIVTLVLYYKYIIKPKKKNITKKGILIRIMLSMFSAIILFYIGRFNYPNNKVKMIFEQYTQWSYHNQLKNYMDNGVIAGFLSNIEGTPMEKPNVYGKKEVENIYNKYLKKANEINENRTNASHSNVIFVMNESFSDPFNLEGLKSNKDPLPNYREIIKETIRGKLLSPTVGGGTANNEFQVLTSLSMEPLNSQITSPYIQLTTKINNFPSIVKKFNYSGYRTTAIHPYDSTFYRRNIVYGNMGFDVFLHQDNMIHREKISNKHPYISDFSAYQEVFRVLDESDLPNFIHLVTMQNHTPFADKYENVTFEVEGPGNVEEANAYFQDLENSDISLRLLINKIEDYHEPILLVFWGDHLPGLYTGAFREKNSGLTMRETPFFIYSNKLELDKEIELLSPMYLTNYVLELLNFEISPYEAMLLDLEKKLPILDNGIYIEVNNNEVLSSRSELNNVTKEILEDYSLLMYDITTGNQYAHDLGFFE